MKKIITIGILCIAMMTMVACTGKSEADTGTTNQDPAQEAVQDPAQDLAQEAVQDPTQDPAQDPAQEAVQDPAQDPAVIEETDPAANDPNATETPTAVNENTLEIYVGFIGLSKDALIEAVGEEPSAIDEGGLEFKNAGLRAWFESDGKIVNQIFTQNKEIDFDGVKIGDKIEQFKTAFGTPVLEATNSTYSNFDYKGLVLHVEYDSGSEKVYAVSLLKEWK